MAAKLEVFFSYAHADEEWRDKLEKHLGSLKRQRRILTWHDRKILPGAEWASEIDTQLRTADIILLLVSPDFISSEYCWSVELRKAIRRHKAGEACVIPIIVRPVDWQNTPFAKLQALPADGKPISTSPNIDEALLQVAKGVRRAIEDLRKKRSANASSPAVTQPEVPKKTPVISQVKEVAAPSQVCNIPYRRNPFFTGREAILDRLHSMLHAGSAAALSQPPAISGLGGIGKTQTAVEYAYRYRDEYQHVLWVQANTRETITSSYVTLAGLLNVTEQGAQDQSLTVQAVRDWLEQHDKWLLIFDNADDLLLVDEFLPSGSNGHILFTTRAHVMSGRAQRVEVEEMDVEEGTLFLVRRGTMLGQDVPLSSVSEAVRTAAAAIVDAVDGLPLALDQAGAYIEETGCGLSRYLELYQTQRKKLNERRSKRPTDHPEPVATTWSLSFQKVEEVNPAAAELLRFCAFLHPDAIPEEFITEDAPFLSPLLQSIANDPMQFDEAIGELLNYSLVRRHPETKTLSMHRLVQAVLKDEMNWDTQEQWVERMVRVVNHLFPFSTAETWYLCQRYLPHAILCAEYIERWKMASYETARLLHHTASYLNDRAQYREAEPFYLRSLAIMEPIWGPGHPSTAASLDNLAVLYSKWGKYEEAEPLHQRALAIRERALGAEHPDTAGSLNNLALLYVNQAKYEEAEPFHQRALVIRERVLGADHPDTAGSLNNLANVYKDQGKDEKAESLYQRALAIKQRVLGADHPDTAQSLNNLALLYVDQGKYEKAEPLYQRALVICARLLGDEYPDTVRVLGNYAKLLKKMGRKGEAAELEARVEAIRGKVRGSEEGK